MFVPRDVIENGTAASDAAVVGTQTWLRSNRLFYLDPTEHHHEAGISRCAVRASTVLT